jgi:antirestriction protein
MTTEYRKPTYREQEELPAIYVADLADYNAGILRGRWIEIDEHTDVADIWEEIREMLAEKGHEEWAVHDYSNLPYDELGEWPNFEQVIEIAHAVTQHGYDLVNGYLSWADVDQLSELGDRLIGIYESVEDYAYEFIDDCYDLEKALGNLAGYFDYRAFARDLELSGDINAVRLPQGTVALFRGH